MAKEAVTKALLDAGLTYDKVEQAAVGYCYGDSTCGQRALYQMGMTQIPIMNVNNNCSTGSTALFLARQAIAGGIVECALALGFEKMAPGSLSSVFNDRTNPMDKFMEIMNETRGFEGSPPASQIFGNAGVEHMEKYGTTARHFAKIGAKNHKHSVLNPYSQFRDEYTVDEVQNARKVFKFLTLLQCCPTSDGAGAAVLASEAFVKAHKLEGIAVEIVAQEMATDSPKAVSGSSIELAGADMTRRATKVLYDSAKISAKDVQVIELHDCFSANELITYEALGLCPEGKAGELIDAGDVTFGGKFVVNPSGGLISKGHPLGATGLAQCCELTWQVRGWCGQRQVPNVKYALQHNVGLGGAVVVTLYSKGFPNVPTPGPSKAFGYNPATKADIIISITDQDYVDLASGKLNGQKAFMSGKLKVKGNMMLATKLETVLKSAQKAPAKL